MFRHKAKWQTPIELLVYGCVVIVVGIFDAFITSFLIGTVALSLLSAKSVACALSLLFNFVARRFFVFPEKSSGEWKPQESISKHE